MDLDRFCLLVLCMNALCVFAAIWWLGKGRRRQARPADALMAPLSEPMFQSRISGPSKRGPFQFCKKGCC